MTLERLPAEIDFLTEAAMEESLQHHLPWIMAEEELWVFASGSLIWNPGFEAATRIPAYAPGWRRRFSLFSIHYRGSLKKPGLVVALTPGGGCNGLALLVPASEKMQILRYLWRREMISYAYLPRRICAYLRGNKKRYCLAFILNKNNPQNGDHLDDEARCKIILEARGKAGDNLDYIRNVDVSLKRYGITCRHTSGLIRRINTYLHQR